MSKKGVAEWADEKRNIFMGCEHGCKYCWAKYNALKRYHWIKTDEEWVHPRFREKAFNEHARKLDCKRIMFPTTHDITPENMDKTIPFIFKWMVAGNRVLIVSKPHLECVKEMCDTFMGLENQVVFRFTIGSQDEDVLRFWEPGATTFKERVECLRYACKDGYQTSVSIEPMLDTNIIGLIDKVVPFVTDSIWVGLLNDFSTRVDMTGWKSDSIPYVDKVIQTFQDDFVSSMYHAINPLARAKKIRWKDSIKSKLNLPEEEIG